MLSHIKQNISFNLDKHALSFRTGGRLLEDDIISGTERQSYLYENSKPARHKGLPAWLPSVILEREQQMLTNLTQSSISVR